MTIAINAAKLATVTSPDDPQVRTLFGAQFGRTLLRLQRIEERLKSEAQQTGEQAVFFEAVQSLRQQPSSVQRQILSTPSLGFWVDVAWELLSRRAHIHFPNLHLMRHLMEFSRFALAALVASGQGEFNAIVWTDQAGRISLPGAAICLVPRDIHRCARVRVQCHKGELQVNCVDIPEPLPFQVVPVNRLANGVELNVLDYDLRLGGRTNFTFLELADVDLHCWTKRLDQAWRMVARVSSSLSDEIRLGVSTIAPIRSTDPSIHLSGSFREAPGLVALSMSDTLRVAEALVHEYHHQKLNALMNFDRLITGPTSDPVYYSPLRDDPRPISGLLHAAYTFTNILGFYVSMVEAGSPTDTQEHTRIENRAFQVGGQVKSCLEELQEHASFSPMGAALVNSLSASFLQYQRKVPLPPPEVQQQINGARQAHYDRWKTTYEHLIKSADSVYRGKATQTADSVLSPSEESNHALNDRIAQFLSLPEGWSPEALQRQWYPVDELLERLRAAYFKDETVPLRALVEATPHASSLMSCLTKGHVAYLEGNYELAEAQYRECLRHADDSPYFWQCYAFALRHQGRLAEGLYILTHTSELVAVDRESPDAGVQTTLSQIRAHTQRVLVARPNRAVDLVTDVFPLPNTVRSALYSSRFWGFVKATRGGAQLPSLIAVAYGLKPAVDIWVPVEGWTDFQKLVETLELEHHIDTYFDRRKFQLEAVPAHQFTTTRAAFSPTPHAGTEAHVFLAKESESLHKAVGAGWYPLVVDGYVINKHCADHDKFGDALGYPRCCQAFFRAHNNWYEDNTYFAALRNTDSTPSIACNPFLRHTVFGLVPHMPCSYACTTTISYGNALMEAITAEFPNYARAIKQALSSPVLCVSEKKIYRFQAELSTTSTVSYHAVQSLYPIEDHDRLYDLLSVGNQCHIDANIVYVFRDGQMIGCYEARGDKHGPECPFIIQFS